MRTRSWQDAFLGVSTMLGESLDGSLAALDDESVAGAAVLVTALRSPSRDVRVRALARAVTAVLVEIDEMRPK